MRLTLLTLLTLLSFTSCQNKFDQEIIEQIQGDWVKEFYPKEIKPDDEPEPEPFFKINVLYSFKNDSIYDANHFAHYNEQTKTLDYLDYKAKFYVKDSLVTWKNTGTKTNIDFGKVKKLTKDTIYFEYFKLVREQYKQYNNDFDAIIVTSSGCYGECPIYNYRLESDGTIIYAGEAYTKNEGVYKAKINSAYFNYFLKSLNQIDVPNLEDEYKFSATDGNYEEVVFIKDQKVIKRIGFYLNDGPHQVKKVLDQLRIMDQYFVNSKPYNQNDYFSTLANLNFVNDEDEHPFYKYKTFYLWTELMRQPTQPFEFKNKTQKINEKGYNYYWGPKVKALNTKLFEGIETDGQRYQIKFKNQRIQYYDLGYNFLEIIK